MQTVQTCGANISYFTPGIYTGGTFPLTISTAGQSGEQTLVITATDPADNSGGRSTINYSVTSKAGYIILYIHMYIQ